MSQALERKPNHHECYTLYCSRCLGFLYKIADFGLMFAEFVFNLHAPSEGEDLFIVGNCLELGSWSPDGAIALQQTEPSQLKFPCNCGNVAQLYSANIVLPTTADILYRYFIGRRLKHDANTAKHAHDRVIVLRWEAGLKARSFRPASNSHASKSCDVFGQIDGLAVARDGWLTVDTLVQFRLHANAINFWQNSVDLSHLSLFLQAFDIRNHSVYSTSKHQSSIGEWISTKPQANVLSTTVAVLSHERCIPKEQKPSGIAYSDNESTVFSVRCLEADDCAFRFQLGDVQAGAFFSAVLAPGALRSLAGEAVLPIIDANHQPVGHLSLDFVVVKPLLDCAARMDVSFAHHWKRRPHVLHIGHRGTGSSHGVPRPAPLLENTVAAFQCAANSGADFVEFDVHLTKDRRAIVFHDFKCALSVCGSAAGAPGRIEVAVKDLTLEELRRCRPTHVWREGESPMDSAADEETFSDFVDVLERVDPLVGAAVELKYPQPLKDGDHECAGYFERNQFVDDILRVVAQHAAARRIVFCCFDADVCLMLRYKQNKYPVLFLTMGDSKRYPPYQDPRTWTVDTAINYARSESLLGLSVDAEQLLKEPRLVERIRGCQLISFVWGEDLAADGMVSRFLQEQIDGVCFDRIDEFGKHRISVFRRRHLERMGLDNNVLQYDSIIVDDVVLQPDR